MTAVACYIPEMAAEMTRAGLLPAGFDFPGSIGCTGVADRWLSWADCPPGHQHPVCTPCRNAVVADGAVGAVDHPMIPA